MSTLYPILLLLIIGISTLSYGFGATSFEKQFSQQELEIPSWIKNVAAWWANNSLSDEEFVNAIGFLINNDIIVIEKTLVPTTQKEQLVPEWVKNTAGWWASESITDKDFLQSMKYLIEVGIISTPPIQSSGVYDVMIGPIPYPVIYDLGNNELLSMEIDYFFNSLVIHINSFTEEKITFDLPRILIDSRIKGSDVEFIVQVNGIDIGYNEKKNDDSRKLTFTILKGDEFIEIIGTQTAGIKSFKGYN